MTSQTRPCCGAHKDSNPLCCDIQGYWSEREQELRRLRSQIEDARIEGRVPGDPDCRYCGGYAYDFDEEGQQFLCECVTPSGLEKTRQMVEERQAEEREKAERDELQWWRDNHGHEKGDVCRPDCPAHIPF